jgi:hypothetical protein
MALCGRNGRLEHVLLVSDAVSLGRIGEEGPQTTLGMPSSAHAVSKAHRPMSALA